MTQFRLEDENTGGKALGAWADFYRAAQSMGRSQNFEMSGELF